MTKPSIAHLKTHVCCLGLLMTHSTRITSMCWHVCMALMSQCTAAVQATFASITAAQEEAGITEVSLLNFAMSDGSTLIATRYVSHEDEEPASLYYAGRDHFPVYPPTRDIFNEPESTTF